MTGRQQAKYQCPRKIKKNADTNQGAVFFVHTGSKQTLSKYITHLPAIPTEMSLFTNFLQTKQITFQNITIKATTCNLS